MILLERHLTSRLFYVNPVCLLSVYHEEQQQSKAIRNVMVCSWLSPIDNLGHLMLSINKKRYTCSFLQKDAYFVLNIPTQGMESLVLDIGTCSGRQVDKFKQFELDMCRPGDNQVLPWPIVHQEAPRKQTARQREQWQAAQSCIAIKDDRIAAHVVCQVVQVIERYDHCILIVNSVSGYVKSEYWHNQHHFIASQGSPPCMKFLGSKTFAYIK